MLRFILVAKMDLLSLIVSNGPTEHLIFHTTMEYPIRSFYCEICIAIVLFRSDKVNIILSSFGTFPFRLFAQYGVVLIDVLEFITRRTLGLFRVRHLREWTPDRN